MPCFPLFVTGPGPGHTLSVLGLKNLDVLSHTHRPDPNTVLATGRVAPVGGGVLAAPNPQAQESGSRCISQLFHQPLLDPRALPRWMMLVSGAVLSSFTIFRQTIVKEVSPIQILPFKAVIYSRSWVSQIVNICWCVGKMSVLQNT